jgi:glucosamine kinase
MIIIADSGSTKCDWLVLNDDLDIINHVKTMGYNPYFHDEFFITGNLRQDDFFKEHHNEVKEVFFYGAGCSTEFYTNIVSKGLSNVFSKAKIKVNHDLMASALASYRGEPIIACILGTGSNSCHFDGETLIPGNPSLGFIVGDEASGSYFGKLLLNAYFNKMLPADLHKEFEKTYALNHDDFTAGVYSNRRANVFLASFMKFFSTRKDHPYIKQVIQNGFRDFIEKHVCCFEDHTKLKVSFVGSIAFFFQEEIEELGPEYNLVFGDFIQKPVFSLVEFHRLGRTTKVKS